MNISNGVLIDCPRCGKRHDHDSGCVWALNTFCRALMCAVVITCASISGAHADDRHDRREQHNYILERQEAYQVQGTPTSRIIIGKREIDVYRDGTMFEKNNVVGVRSR
jgi:hypothetical protein